MPEGSDKDIVIRGILRDELSEPAADMQRSLDDLGDGMRNTADAADELSEAERRNQQQSEKTTRQLNAEAQARDELGRFTREQTDAVEKNTKSQKGNTTVISKSTKVFSKSTKVMGKFTGVFMGLLKAGAVLDMISMAAQGITALGGVAVAAGNGIVIMSGALLAMPGLLSGVGQAAIVGKLAFKGMGDAVKALASGDFAAFGEATKDMGPNMTNAAKSAGMFGQRLKPLVRDMQERVWKGMGAQIEELGNKIFPMLRRSVMQTADAIGKALSGFTRFLNSAKGMRDMNTILKGNAIISGDFARGVGQGMQALTKITASAMPAAIVASERLSGIFESLNDVVDRNRDKIAQFAMTGVNVFSRFMGIVSDLAVGLWNIGKAGMGLTRTLGTGLEDVARKFREWTGSVEGQNKMKQYFEDMKPTLSALGNLAKVIGTAFLQLGQNTNLADLINQLAGVVPTFQQLVEQASGRFLPAMLDIAQSFADVVLESNVLQVTSVLLTSAAWAAEKLAAAFGALPGPVQTTIGTLVGLGLVIKTLAGTFIPGLLMKIPFISRAVAAARYQMMLFSRSMSVAFASGGIKGAIGMLVLWFKKLALAIKGVGLAMKAAFLSNPIGWIILAVIVLIGVFVLLWKKCEGFRNLVKAIGQWFVDVWNNVLYPAVMKVWEWMKMAWDKVYAVVSSVVGAIIGWFQRNWNTIKTVVMVVFSVIKTIISTYIKVYITIFKVVFTVVKAVFMGIVAVVRFIWPIISGLFKMGYQIIRVIVLAIALVFKIAFYAILFVAKLVWKGIVASAKVVWMVLRPLFMAILAVWKFIWNAIKFVFTAIWNAILAVIRFMMPIWMAILNGIRTAWNWVWNIIKAVVSAVINTIIAIIQRIVGFVMNVVNTVRAIWDAAWNALSGIVRAVVDRVRGIIDGILGVVRRVTDGVRNAFSSAFNRIRDIVMPIINAIKETIDRITSAAKGLGDTISNLNPGNWFAAGGAVSSGMRAMVGELGPEAFVTHTGKVSMIGTHGPEIRDFSQAGYVVPNHVLRGYGDSSVPHNVMKKLAAASAPSTGGFAAPAQASDHRSNLSSNDYMSGGGGGGNHYSVKIDAAGGDPKAIAKAVKAAIREIERDKKERG
ncbi:tape measure protein [Gordonia phage Gray]|nr:tape measure protein [Gordonia phage Gray]